jgi:hypothetical protein
LSHSASRLTLYQTIQATGVHEPLQVTQLYLLSMSLAVYYVYDIQLQHTKFHQLPKPPKTKKQILKSIRSTNPPNLTFLINAIRRTSIDFFCGKRERVLTLIAKISKSVNYAECISIAGTYETVPNLGVLLVKFQQGTKPIPNSIPMV